MKKLFIPLLLMFLAVATSCNRSKSNPNDVDVETYFVNDSILFDNEYEEGYSRYTMNIRTFATTNLKQHKTISIKLDDEEDN